MKNTKKYISYIIIILLIIIEAFFVVKKELQNDTFYSIKIGEYITQNGINSLKIDKLSWHKNLEYCNPHILSDIIIYISFYLRKLLRGIYININNFSNFRVINFLYK